MENRLGDKCQYKCKYKTDTADNLISKGEDFSELFLVAGAVNIACKGLTAEGEADDNEHYYIYDF